MSNLEEFFTFPFQTAESRKNFLIGCLVMLVGFFIPMLPYIIAYGYVAQIVKQVANGEKPNMPAWDNLEGMFMGGLRLYGVKMIYALPLIVVMLGGMGVAWVGMMAAILSENEQLIATMMPLMMTVVFSMICIAMPLGIVVSLVSYPASIHAVVKEKFFAGFNIKECWPILRANLGGFVIAIVILYVVSFGISFAMQIVMYTIILACLLPLLMPVLMFYMVLVPDLLFAQAYRDGLEKLAASPASEA